LDIIIVVIIIRRILAIVSQLITLFRITVRNAAVLMNVRKHCTVRPYYSRFPHTTRLATWLCWCRAMSESKAAVALLPMAVIVR